MNRYVKSALLAGAAWSAMSTLAVAQDATTEPQATALDDVIVTARRTEESLQRTPLAVSAFSGEQLAAQGAQQVTDLQGAERDAAWERFKQASPGFADYEVRTTRTIPVLALRRV